MFNKNSNPNGSRREKIRLLQALKEGKISPEALGESIHYLATVGLWEDGKYTITERRPNPAPAKHLTPEEFTEWYNQIQEVNKIRSNHHKVTIMEWTEEKTYEGRTNDPIT